MEYYEIVEYINNGSFRREEKRRSEEKMREKERERYEDKEVKESFIFY